MRRWSEAGSDPDWIQPGSGPSWLGGGRAGGAGILRHLKLIFGTGSRAIELDTRDFDVAQLMEYPGDLRDRN